VATSADHRQGDVPAEQVDAVVRRLAASLERHFVTVCTIAILPTVLPIIAFWKLLAWWVALALTGGWLMVLEILFRRLGAFFARRAAGRFNRKFPEGSAARPVALGIVAGLQSQYSYLKKWKVALGLPPQAPPAPPSSPGPPPADSAPAKLGGGAPAVSSSLHLGRPSASSAQPFSTPGSGRLDYIPLELKGGPGDLGAEPPPSGPLAFLPLEPLEKTTAGTEKPRPIGPSPGGLRFEPAQEGGQRERSLSTLPPVPDLPDWLAGSHNVELTESAGSVLLLQSPRLRDVALWPLLRQLLFPGKRPGACASINFYRQRGFRPRYWILGLPGRPRGRLPADLRKPRPLQDIAAVELAPHAGDAPEGPGATSRPMCRLRLLLRDAKLPILELAPHADLAWARETGGRLARFLGVPLQDRIHLGTPS
jgi:hypothetical protein